MPDLKPSSSIRRRKLRGLPWTLEVASPGRKELKGPQSLTSLRDDLGIPSSNRSAANVSSLPKQLYPWLPERMFQDYPPFPRPRAGFDSGPSYVFADIDECEQPGVCSGGRCSNTEGSYHCECDRGYIMVRKGHCQGKELPPPAPLLSALR